jgi:hypothetical protein
MLISGSHTAQLSQGQLISSSDAISCQGKLKTKVNSCTQLECGDAQECRNMAELIYVQMVRIQSAESASSKKNSRTLQEELQKNFLPSLLTVISTHVTF